MIRPINPHNLLPIWLGLPDKAKQGHVLTPLTVLPPFQFQLSGSGPTVTTFDIYAPETGAVIAQNAALVVRTPVTGSTFYSYSGATLTNALTAGTNVHGRITMSDGAVYHTHALCPTAIYATDLVSLAITACSQPVSNQYTFTFTATIPTGAGWSVLVSDDNSDQTTTATDRTFTLNQTFGTEATGAKSFTITARAAYATQNGEATDVKVYRLIFTTLDPCGTYSLTLESEAQTQDGNIYHLNITNGGVDQQSMGILYQDGFQQRLYFIGHEEPPEPVVSETFQETAPGGLALQTALFRERYSLSFWPCPDPVFVALQALQYASGATVRAYAGVTTTLARYTATSIVTANEQLLGCTLACEVGGVRVERCEENYT